MNGWDLSGVRLEVRGKLTGTGDNQGIKIFDCIMKEYVEVAASLTRKSLGERRPLPSSSYSCIF